jgi:hypothetical protein
MAPRNQPAVIETVATDGRAPDPSELLAIQRAAADPPSLSLDFGRVVYGDGDPRCLVLRSGRQSLWLTPDQARLLKPLLGPAADHAEQAIAAAITDGD